MFGKYRNLRSHSYLCKKSFSSKLNAFLDSLNHQKGEERTLLHVQYTDWPDSHGMTYVCMNGSFKTSIAPTNNVSGLSLCITYSYLKNII